MLNRKGRLSLSLLQFKRESELDSTKGKKKNGLESLKNCGGRIGYLQMPHWF